MSGGLFAFQGRIMEAVIFVGLPGSGKSSFFKERFFQTHVRISLDLLKTRHREQRIMGACLETDQRFVIDNTNPTRLERAGYIEAAKANRFRITGYYFQSKVEDCLRRNAERTGNDRVPDVAILSTAKKLELPCLDEGFGKLFYVRLDSGRFVIEEWRDDV
jgi:predicted kinase